MPRVWWWAFAALTLLWLVIIQELRFEWSSSSPYSYGVFVPLLAAYFFVRDWYSRPLPPPINPARKRRSDSPAPPAIPTPPRTPALLLLGCALLVLLPVRLVQEANGDWRMVAWLHLILTGLATGAALWWIGGYTWLRHFAPAFALFPFAVPWPTKIEQFATQTLMTKVSSLTVELLNDIGIAAVQRGNLIEVAAGTVGIDEACSGVRSLQACVAVAIFLSLLRKLGIGRALILLILGVGTALTANLARAFGLALAQAKGGAALADKWHDTAGVVELALCLAVLWFAAAFLAPAEAEPEPDAPKKPVKPTPLHLQTPTVAVCATMIGWLVFVEVGTETWYRVHERRAKANPPWTVAWPQKEKEFIDVRIPDRVLMTLSADENKAASWVDERDAKWSAAYARWRSGRPVARIARVHRPDICFAASGRRLRADLGTTRVQAGPGLELAFQSYVFDAPPGSRGTGDLFVFYCLWEDRTDTRFDPDPDAPLMPTFRRRFEFVSHGLRDPEQRTLEISIGGARNAEDAIQSLRKRLPGLIKR